MTKFENKISKDLQVTDLIYRDPSGANDEQARIYLEIDWVDHTVEVNTSLSMDRNSISLREYHGRLTRIRLSNSVDARGLREEIDKYIPTIEEISESYDEHYDGRNWIGNLSYDNEERLMSLGENLLYNLPELDRGYTDAYDWYEDDKETLREDTKGVTGKELEAYIADCEKEALWDGVVLYNLERLIRDLQEE